MNFMGAGNGGKKNDPVITNERLKKVKDAFKEGKFDSGSGDTVSLDTNGDGMVDTVGVDMSGDGEIDTVVVDTNHDGRLDTIAEDTTGDGVFDSQLSTRKK